MIPFPSDLPVPPGPSVPAGALSPVPGAEGRAAGREFAGLLDAAAAATAGAPGAGDSVPAGLVMPDLEALPPGRILPAQGASLPPEMPPAPVPAPVPLAARVPAPAPPRPAPGGPPGALRFAPVSAGPGSADPAPAGLPGGPDTSLPASDAGPAALPHPPAVPPLSEEGPRAGDPIVPPGPAPSQATQRVEEPDTAPGEASSDEEAPVAIHMAPPVPAAAPQPEPGAPAILPAPIAPAAAAPPVSPPPAMVQVVTGPRAGVARLTLGTDASAPPPGPRPASEGADADADPGLAPAAAPSFAAPASSSAASPSAAPAVPEAPPPVSGHAAAPQPVLTSLAAAPLPDQSARGPGLDTAIAQADALREALRAQRPELVLRHGDFGPVSVRLEAAASEQWRAVLSSRDPGFVPAIQTALAERAIAAAAESAAGFLGQHAGGQGSAGQHGAGQNGTGEHRYGASPSGGQGGSQPYLGQSPSRDGEAAPDHRRPSTAAALAARGGAEEDRAAQPAPGRGGLFA